MGPFYKPVFFSPHGTMHLKSLDEYRTEDLQRLARRYNVKRTRLVTRYRPGNPRRYRSRSKLGLYRALQAMYTHHGRRDERCHRLTSRSRSRVCRTPYWLS